MTLPPNFPASPHAILDPGAHWVPDEPDSRMEKLPPLVQKLRETKGREELDVPRKMERLKQWCRDVNLAQSAVAFHFVYVDQNSFDQYRPQSFDALITHFR